jgi:hypothetical protein
VHSVRGRKVQGVDRTCHLPRLSVKLQLAYGELSFDKLRVETCIFIMGLFLILHVRSARHEKILGFILCDKFDWCLVINLRLRYQSSISREPYASLTSGKRSCDYTYLLKWDVFSVVRSHLSNYFLCPVILPINEQYIKGLP